MLEGSRAQMSSWRSIFPVAGCQEWGQCHSGLDLPGFGVASATCQPYLLGGTGHLLESPASCQVGYMVNLNANSPCLPGYYPGIPTLCPFCGKQVGEKPFLVFHIGPGKVEEVEIFLWSELLPEARNVRCPQLFMASSPSGSHVL